MPFKINISDKGKTFRLEADTEYLLGKKIGEKIEGSEIKPELVGYELLITGTSDKAGFPGKKDIEGPALRKVLLTSGFSMKKRPRKEGKKKRGKNMPKGLRLKKTVRGNNISRDTIQINTKVIKEGGKKLAEIFPKTGEEGEKSSEITETKEEKPAEQLKEKTEERKEKNKGEAE